MLDDGSFARGGKPNVTIWIHLAVHIHVIHCRDLPGHRGGVGARQGVPRVEVCRQDHVAGHNRSRQGILNRGDVRRHPAVVIDGDGSADNRIRLDDIHHPGGDVIIHREGLPGH